MKTLKETLGNIDMESFVLGGLSMLVWIAVCYLLLNMVL